MFSSSNTDVHEPSNNNEEKKESKKIENELQEEVYKSENEITQENKQNFSEKDNPNSEIPEDQENREQKVQESVGSSQELPESIFSDSSQQSLLENHNDERKTQSAVEDETSGEEVTTEQCEVGNENITKNKTAIEINGTTIHFSQKIDLYNLSLPYEIYESEETSEWIWIANDKEDIEFLKRESEIYTKLSKITNLFPRVKGSYEVDDSFVMITEALPKQNLAQMLEEKTLNFTDFLLVLSQVSQALSSLHKLGYVYRALRPEVILVGKPIKIVDMRWISEIGEVVEKGYDFGVWSSPESLRTKNKIDQRSDIYSIGMILYSYFSGQHRNTTFEQTECMNLDFEVSYPGLPQILSRTCVVEVDERYYSAEILRDKLAKLRKSYIPKINYEIHGQTTIGLEKSRRTNQDAYGFLNGVWKCENDEISWMIACVADGMGGMEAGEIASEIAVKYILKKIMQDQPFNVSSVTEQNNYLKSIIVEANKEVIKELKNRRADGGTTIVSAFALNENMVINYVGDSRAYLIRDRKIQFLTRDHSLAAILALQTEGSVNMKDLRNNENRNMLALALGTRDNLVMNQVGDLSILTGSNSLKLQDGDILLLCSDGVWEPVTEEEMLEICIKNTNLRNTASEILNLSIQRGGHDNATIVLVKVVYYLDNPINL